MASAVSMGVLQADPDEGINARGQTGYKSGNLEVIRTMLREQQRDLEALHANALFREFRGASNQKGVGKGWNGDRNEGPSIIEDASAVGQERMFELIRQTAIKEERPAIGVWASFGKPYICLGEPQDPGTRLPTLYRDELNNIDNNKNAAKGGGKQRKQQAAPAAQQLVTNPTETAGPGTNTAGQPPGTAGSNRCGSRGGSARRIGTAASMASLEGTLQPHELAELRLNKIKTVMQFGGNDQIEAAFPQGPLKQASQRRKRSQARPGSFVDPTSASHEVADPFLSYGQPPVPHRVLKPITKKTMDLAKTDNVFITQEGMVPVQEEASEDDLIMPSGSRRSHVGSRSSAAGLGLDRTLTTSGSQLDITQGSWANDHDADDTAGGGLGPHGINAAGHSGPSFQPLVQEAAPMRGDEDNPVYAWHNNFLRVRQAGRAALQTALYERAEGRFRARTVGPMAANLSSILMADLDLVRGKQVPYASVGLLPNSPYVKMDSSWAALQEKAATAARAAQQLDPEELRLLQRFYDQLCALVEAQRMSDPLSLMVVHKVKTLLEEGTFLQRAMFEGVITHVGAFVASTGMRKYNKYMRSILTFIAKCTGVSDADFEAQIDKAKLTNVVFSNPLPSFQMPEPSGTEEMGSPTSRRTMRHGSPTQQARTQRNLTRAPSTLHLSSPGSQRAASAQKTNGSNTEQAGALPSEPVGMTVAETPANEHME